MPKERESEEQDIQRVRGSEILKNLNHKNTLYFS